MYPHSSRNITAKSKKHELLIELFAKVTDTADGAAKETALTNYNAAIAYMISECYSRVIGIALSGAAPGAMFQASSNFHLDKTNAFFSRSQASSSTSCFSMSGEV